MNPGSEPMNLDPILQEILDEEERPHKKKKNVRLRGLPGVKLLLLAELCMILRGRIRIESL